MLALALIVIHMKTSNEFIKGKHSIGYVSSDFEKYFGNTEFEAKTVPAYQVLPRRMNDAEIEGELKPGISELGDILAFLDSAPTECKDGNWNLFYTEAYVVLVRWDAEFGVWDVHAWGRGVGRWCGGFRVFSPVTETSKPSDLSSLETLTLSAVLKRVESLETIVKHHNLGEGIIRT